MSKKRKQKKRSSTYRSHHLEPLEPHTKRGILVVIFFAFGFISILSFFDLAGGLGRFIETVLVVFFGWGKFLFPIVLLVLAYLYLNYERYDVKFRNYLGLFLFILSLSAIFHLVVPLKQAKEIIGQNRGGGYLGYILSYPLQNVMGFWASLILLVSIVVASLLIMFETSLDTLIDRSRFITQIFIALLRIPRLLIEFLKNRSLVSGYDSQDYRDQEDEEYEKDLEVEDKEFGFEASEIQEQYSNTQKGRLKQQKLLKDYDSSQKTSKTISDIQLSLDLLDDKRTRPAAGDIKNNQLIIRKTLENFGIEVEMGEVNIGPTVAQYTLRPAEGIKLSKITTLHNDLSLALAAHPIRIEAPIPGKSLVGIEVPNKSVAIVSLKEVLSDERFKNRRSNLTIALGKDVSGEVWFADMETMPHLLIAGATGSGKTVCINSIILNLLYQNNPAELKFILVDPKRVELPLYNGIPYLLTPVITDIEKTINALKWAIFEMERRFELLSKMGKRNIQTYNRIAHQKLPYIVIIIDELADIMAASAREVESLIVRLAQMSRAVGIHLVLATQRPSVDIITGLIKANITSRIAFSVASIVDSRTILDTSGAEKLLGRGDMLYMCAELTKPKRLQGALVTDQEIARIVNYLKERGLPEYNDEIVQKHIGINTGNALKSGISDENSDELLDDAKEVILQAGRASASLLQRRLRVGYARAARILDLLEEEGFIGPADGAKPREVFGGGVKSDSVEDTINEVEEKEEL